MNIDQILKEKLGETSLSAYFNLCEKQITKLHSLPKTNRHSLEDE